MRQLSARHCCVPRHSGSSLLRHTWVLENPPSIYLGALILYECQQSTPASWSGQRKFLQLVKRKLSASAPNHVIGTYPFDGLWVHPPDPTMLKTVKLEDHHLRSILVWVPEYSFPHALPEGRPPCPRCKTTVNVIAKGFTSRRAILRDSYCDLLGYLYHCNGCENKNKGKDKVR